MTTAALRHPIDRGLRIDMNGQHGWKSAYAPIVDIQPDRFHLKHLLLRLVRLYDETGLQSMRAEQAQTLRVTAWRLLHVASRRPESKQRDLRATWSEASYLYLRIEDGLQAINVMALPISKAQFLTTTPPVQAAGDAVYATFVEKVVTRTA